ncbi:MAG: acetate--CoA ligase family protein [Candidatus Diapherotrites archaeon]
MKQKKKEIQPMDFLLAGKLTQKYGIPMAPMHAIRKEKDIMGIEKKIPFPWVMKAVGKKILHKTDVGGIKLNLNNSHDTLMAFHTLKKIPGCEYVVAQPMREGIEIIVGGKIDPQFGPTVLVGMGGIYTEVLKDSSVRIAPLQKEDAESMVKELKMYPILKGIRGQKKINFSDLTKIILGVSKLMQTGKIKELDLNPVLATHERVEGVDVRIIQE